MARHRNLGESSEKDRVRLKVVLEASRLREISFLWRGARWRAQAGVIHVQQHDGRGGSERPPSLPRTRVLVTRASGLARIAEREGDSASS